MSVLFMLDVKKRKEIKKEGTDADAEALAEEELPIFRALCVEEHAHHEERGREEYG